MRFVGSRYVLTTTLLALCAIGVATPSLAQTTSFIDGDPRSGPAPSYSFPLNAFEVARVDDQTILVRVLHLVGAIPIATHFLTFSSGDGQPLAPGMYLSAARHPAPFHGLDYSYLGTPLGTSRGCPGLTGRFLVREVSYASDGTVLTFAVDFEAHCQDAPEALFGVLRYHSTVPTDIFPGEIDRYSLTIDPPSHGLVTGSGISCGSGQTSCAMTFATAISATLNAIPDPGYIFTGWTGGCAGPSTTVVNVNSIKECGATFATAVPTEPRTLLTLNGDQGDPVTNGRSEVYDAANSRWSTVHGDFGNGERVSLSVWGLSYPTDVQWKVAFRAVRGTALGVGRYSNVVTGVDDPSPDKPGLEIAGDVGCNSGRVGEFVIDQIAFNSDGSLRAFAANFEQRCVNGSVTQPRLRGTIGYNSTLAIVPCATPDPFASLGGGTCYNGGWLPPGMPPPSTGGNPTPPPPPPSGCATPDPFTAIGGGTCVNGGWLPPGMPAPGGGNNPPPPTACTIPDPFVSLGGGTCRNGGWLPPGMH